MKADQRALVFIQDLDGILQLIPQRFLSIRRSRQLPLLKPFVQPASPADPAGRVDDLTADEASELRVERFRIAENLRMPQDPQIDALDNRRGLTGGCSPGNRQAVKSLIELLVKRTPRALVATGQAKRQVCGFVIHRRSICASML
jgi:hypothetical protein